ncbi:MAG: patatin-like phospholipase family protein [Rickettsiales bacterium]|nr:patatin-like phospholipase family protein [Rickettsiales bacterium]
MTTNPSASRPIAFALQGGATHGAFTWGVLDRFLTDERVHIEAISASSSGAMMATVLAQGLLEGGKEGARERLQTLWKKLHIAAGMIPLRMQVVDKFLSHVGIDLSPSSMALDYITRIFSPSQFNLFDINPLRDIVDELVDFGELAASNTLALYINTTNAKTGESRIFSHKDISLAAVMASNCLPFLFKAVEIDDELYWDGSFSGCPPLMPLADHHAQADLLLVQVHAMSVDEVPSTATDILDRATEMGFNNILRKDIELLDWRNQMIYEGKLKATPTRLHRISAQDELASLGRASKLNTDWDFIMYLHDLGMQAANDWLENAFATGKPAKKSNAGR